jgi:hypothetical protein
MLLPSMHADIPVFLFAAYTAPERIRRTRGQKKVGHLGVSSDVILTARLYHLATRWNSDAV